MRLHCKCDRADPVNSPYNCARYGFIHSPRYSRHIAFTFRWLCWNNNYLCLPEDQIIYRNELIGNTSNIIYKLSIVQVSIGPKARDFNIKEVECTIQEKSSIRGLGLTVE